MTIYTFFVRFSRLIVDTVDHHRKVDDTIRNVCRSSVGNDNFIGSDISVHRALVVCYRVVADGQDFVVITSYVNSFVSLVIRRG